MLDSKRVRDAITIYERMSTEGVEVSRDTLKRLFFLTCYYNGSNAPSYEEEEWHGMRNFGLGLEQPVAFEEDGVADLLFEATEKSADVYSAMIAGLCKYPSSSAVKKARVLYEKMKEERLTPHVEAFCGLIENAKSFEDACLICKEMSAARVSPNIHDNSVDHADAVGKILQEAKKCSCEYSLSTYRELLKLSHSKSDKKLNVTYVVQILDNLESCESICAAVAKEQLFFVDAMEIAYSAKNYLLAERIKTLYESPKNKAKLPELSDEPKFYAYYLQVSIPMLSIESLEKRYKSLVPRIVGLSRNIAHQMLDRLQRDYKWSLLRRVIEDIIAARHFLDNMSVVKSCSVISLLNFKLLSPDERDECRALANRIVDVLNDYSRYSGYVQKKWTPRTIALCARMLMAVGEKDRAWELFETILDKKLTEGEDATVSPIGYPSAGDVIRIMDNALNDGNWEHACICLEVVGKYATELKMSVGHYAKKILSTCKMSSLQKIVLKNYANLRDYS
ncbi:unnamed protein product [Enterobius vermicularis]|uniref:Small ribosomal subunit protein mS39 n=1 Tax=Enterobius vermicularis TaxID=51028 RepID=A0A158QBG0_ENTVE|nr:unnamed protein product [Enterobius vermicularis]